MRGFKSGDLVCTAAGLALMFAALSPWAVSETGDVGHLAFGLGLGGLAALVLLGAGGLMGSGLMRTSWTALVAMAVAFLAGMAVFSAAVPAHAPGMRPGFGIFALAAGGVAAVVGAVLNAIERTEGAL